MSEQMLVVAAAVVLMILNTVGLILTAFQLPGTWLIVLATALMGWWRWDAAAEPMIGWWALGLLLALAVLGEVLEFIAGALGSSQAGGSWRSGMLAIAGGILGAVVGTVLLPIPVIGTLVGAALGAAAGSLLGERWAGREWAHSFRVGQGAAVGRLLGSVAKLVVAAVMWVIVGVALVW
jgi:uncharacterized protein YqgC (DUF456 family)